MLDILWPIAGGFIRHLINSLAVYLVTVGLLPSAQANAFAGALLVCVSVGWSIWHKVNTPEGLAILMKRMGDSNVKRVWADTVLKGSGLVLAGFVVFAMLAPKAEAQTFSFFGQTQAPAKKRHHVRPQPPMHAGLQSLIQQVSPVQLSIQSPEQVVANLEKVALADLQMALASANAVNPPTVASKSRVACYTEIVAFLSRQTSAQAAVAGQAVGSGVFSKFEVAAQLADSLQSGSPMQVACAPVAQAVRLQFTQFLTSVTAGGLGLAKFGVLP